MFINKAVLVVPCRQRVPVFVPVLSGPFGSEPVCLIGVSDPSREVRSEALRCCERERERGGIVSPQAVG